MQDEKKKRLLDSVERYAEAREEVAKSRAAVMIEIDQLIIEAPAPIALIEPPKRKGRPRLGHETQAKPMGRATNKERVFRVFKDAGTGVRIEAAVVRDRAGCGDNTFVYLSQLAREGIVDRIAPGIYALKG